MSHCLWPHRLQHASSPSFTVSWSLLRFVSFESVMLFNHLILFHHFVFCLQSCPASGSFPMSRLFASGGQNIRSFSFIINPSSEYPGLIFFRIDSFDLLAVQGTLKSLLQHQNSKASILQCSTFFMVQLTSIYDY